MFAFRRPRPSRVRRRAALRLDTFEERTVPAVAVGVNVNSTQSDQTPPLGNSGAVGPNHYVQFATGQFTVFDKAGAVASQVTETAFWSNAGVPSTVLNDLLSQPRVVYDPISGRWFAAEVTVKSTDNQVLVARSNSSDPAATPGNWTARTYTATAGQYGSFPTLAVDKNGVYVGTGNFTTSGSGGQPTGSTMTSIPKADLLLATPTLDNRTQVTQTYDILFNPSVPMGWSPQAVTNFDTTDNSASVIATHYTDFNQIGYWQITGSGGANATFGGTSNLTIPHNALPAKARQPDGTQVLSGGDDDRYTGAAFQVGDLIYAVHAISVNGSGVGTDAGQGTPTTDAIQLVVIRDSTHAVVTTKNFFNPNYDYTFPSVSANQYGDVVIGFNRSGGTGSTNGNVGAYAIYARIDPANPGGGVTELGTAELQAGLFNAYHLSGGAVSVEQWGPYSATSVDPSDPFAFWTTAQFAKSNAAGESQWATKVSQVLVSPRALTVSASPSTGTFGAGQTIDITVAFNGPVTVTGTPQLTLNSGGTATYFSGSGSNVLTFRYTVGATDSTTDLDYTAAGINLNGGTINHTSGNFGVPAELTLPAPGTTGSLGANTSLVIQANAASTGVSSTNGTYGAGQTLSITVTFSKPVVVNTTNGTPSLALNSGGTATYFSGSESNALTFHYTVAAGQSSADLDYSSATALTLNGGTINDQGTNSAAGLTLPAPGATGSLGATNNIVIDAVAPTVSGVTSTNGTYGFGQTISITVTFSKAVTVNTAGGTPSLALNSGGTATYFSGSGSPALVFHYAVGATDSTTDLDYSSAGALTLNGGTIVGVVSNVSANLTLPAPGAVGSLGASNDIVIDTTRASMINVTSPTANGTYGVGTTIDVTVQFDRAVTVTGTPQLALNSGGTATYLSGSTTTALTFRYTVGSGESAADLDYASAAALTGGTIRDGNGVDANRTLPGPGGPGSLGANKALAVDAVGPTVLEFRVLFGSKKYDLLTSTRTNTLPWLVTGIQVVFDEPVRSGNVRSLGGLTASRLSGLGTKTLTWNFAGLAKAAPTATLASTGPNALRDKAGNPIAAFSKAFRVLYGDFTDDGFVTAADEIGVRANMSAPYQLLNPVGYNIFADLSGDGLVNLIDVGITRTRRGTSLP